MSQPDSTRPPSQRPVAFKSKKRIKEEWAKLDLSDLEDAKPPTEEHEALHDLYQDDLHGLGNE
ncbi:MAG: hypothetical protein GWM98_08710 [Nitrospinaceae bacterium]|nr:hypothetical protein [Nitrospinaceae bacterium]